MATFLTQSLVYALAGLAIASVGGFTIHTLVIRWPDKAHDFFYYFALVLAGCFGLFLWASVSFSLPSLAALLAVCATGALADRAAEQKRITWTEAFFRLILSTTASILLLSIVSPLTFALVVSRIGRPSASVFYSGLVIGVVCSPTVLAVFRWMFSTLQLRPGIDRHLNEDDEAA